MPNNDDLSPEEVQELEGLESQEVGESEELSEAENLELQQLEAQEADEVSGPVVPPVEDIINEQPDIEDVGKLETVMRSAAEGFTLGFSGEIGGLYQAGVEMAQGGTDLSSFSMNYRRHRDSIDKLRKAGEKKYGNISLASELAGGMLVPLPGSGLKAGMKLGAVAGAGKGEGLVDSVTGAVGGAAFALGVGKLADAGSPVFKQMYKKATGYTKKIEAVTKDMSNTVLSSLNVAKKSGGLSATKHAKIALKELSNRGKSLDDWGREISHLPSSGGKQLLIEKGDDSLKLLNKAKNEISSANNDISDILGAIDEKLIEIPSMGVKTTSIGRRFGENLIQSVDDPAAQKELISVIKSIGDTPYLSLTETRMLADDVIGVLKNIDSPSSNIKSLINKVHIGAEKEISSVIQRLDHNSLAAYVGKKEIIDNFRTVKKVVSEASDYVALPLEESMQNGILQNLAKFGTGVVAGSPAMMASSVGTSILKIIKSPDLIHLNSRKLASYNKIANKIMSNPEKYSKMATKIALASVRTREDFMLEMGSAQASIVLEENPLNGSIDDMLVKLPEVHTLVSEVDEKAANLLMQEVENGNDAGIGEIMSNLRRSPASAKFIEPGYGWDGKAYTMEDIQQATGIINNSDMSQTQKMFKLDKLNAVGELPVMEPPVDMIKEVTRSKRSKGKKDQKL